VTDERRWVDRDDVPEDVAALLRGGTKARPIGAAALARSRRRIAALGAVPVAAGSLFWMNAAFGAAFGVVVTTAAVVVVPRYTSPAAAPSATVSSSAHGGRSSPQVAAVPLSPSASPAQREDETAPAAPPLAPVHARAPAVVETGPRLDRRIAEPSVQAPGAPDAGEGLAREARLLERARAVVSSDPGAALAVLDEHGRAFPAGSLVLERELLAVDALLRLGRRADAEARARSIRERAPGSLYTRRLEHLLRGAP
jgi:hypothetical protein